MRLFPADYRLVQYSSDQVAESERLSAWGEVLSQLLLKVEVHPLTNTPFQVEATLRALPGIRFGIGIFGPCVSRRTREIAEADPDDFYLIINTEGVFNISQANGDVVLKEGDACLMRCSQEADLIRAVAGRLIFARFERVSVSARIPDIDDYGGQIIRIGNEALHLLTAYLRIIDGRQKLSSPQLRQSIIEHIYSLLELVLVSSRVSVQPIHNAGSGAVQMDILKRFISERLSNPQLSLAMVAAANSLSPRHVQRLFGAERTTFSKFILLKRLQRVHSDLLDPKQRRLGVGDLALAAGFSDISSFNRAFLRHLVLRPPRSAVRCVSDNRNREMSEALSL